MVKLKQGESGKWIHPANIDLFCLSQNFNALIFRSIADIFNLELSCKRVRKKIKIIYFKISKISNPKIFSEAASLTASTTCSSKLTIIGCPASPRNAPTLSQTEIS
jgi:hypothetical protein